MDAERIRAQRIRAQINSEQPWERRPDGWWLVDSDLDVPSMARQLLDGEARLVTITARPAPQGECRMVYHWDVAGELLSCVTTTREGRIESIAAICPAADWIEREIHDYFAVDFAGRDDLEPLVLRQDDRPGLFDWDGSDGRQA